MSVGCAGENDPVTEPDAVFAVDGVVVTRSVRRLSALVARCPYLDREPARVWLAFGEPDEWRVERPAGPAANLPDVRAELDRARREIGAAELEPEYDLPRFRPVDR